jgi:hypothetical protein
VEMGRNVKHSQGKQKKHHQSHKHSSKLNQDILPLLGVSFNYNLQSKYEANI